MARRWTLHAGCGVSQVINFRSLRSTARTSAAPSAGSRNLACLCVHATGEHTIAMVRAPRGRRSAVSSSIQTRLRTAWSPFKPVNCRHRGLLHFSAEKSHHAHDCENWAMVRSPLTACGAHSRSGRASGATKHGQLVVRVWQRRAHRFPPATGYRNSVGTDLCALCRRGVEQPAGPESRYRAWLVHPRHAWMGIEASIASRVPILGPAIVKLMLGGPIIAGATLSRFFALHVFVIPGLLIGFVALHLL